MKTDTPNFILKPITDTELETARLLNQDKIMKEVAAIRGLSLETIKAHTRSMRFKYHADTTPRTLNRMRILKVIPHQLNQDDFPAHWRQYIPQ